MKSVKSDCLFPNCENTEASRGLCSLHYQYANRAVLRGKTTWEKLEKDGKANAPVRVRSNATAWFAGEEEHHIQE